MTDTRGSANALLRYRELTLDPAGYCVTLRDRPLLLTKREFVMLWYMLSAPPGRVFSRWELSKCDRDGGPGGKKSAVYVHICHIRKKIRKVAAEEYIETVRGRGFRLAAR